MGNLKEFLENLYKLRETYIYQTKVIQLTKMVTHDFEVIILLDKDLNKLGLLPNLVKDFD